MFNQAILGGLVDFYCLVCEKHLKSDRCVSGHILNPTHKSNIETVGYLEKFKEHCIRKVKQGYFCEFCNLLLLTNAKVPIHIKTIEHVFQKGGLGLQRIGGEIVAFDDIFINESAWNGIVDGTCLHCNVEFIDAELHQAQVMHKLNLVQHETQFGDWGILYRMIDSSSFYCLPCNKAFLVTVFSTHFDSVEHTQNCLKLNPNNSHKHTMEPVADLSRANSDLSLYMSLPLQSKPARKAKKPERKYSAACAELANDDATKRILSATSASQGGVSEMLSASSFQTKNEKGEMFCILCAKTLTAHTTSTHQDDDRHQYLLKEHYKRLERRVYIEKLENESAILGELHRYVREKIKIDFKKSVALCKLCCKEISLIPQLIDEHIDYHKIAKAAALAKSEDDRVVQEVVAQLATELFREEAEMNTVVQTDLTDTSVNRGAAQKPLNVTNTTLDETERAQWVSKHCIVIKHTQNKVRCNICNSILPTSVKNIREHITGNSHQSNLTKKLIQGDSLAKLKTKPTKVRLMNFIKSIYVVESLIFRFVLINDKFIIGYKSLSTLENRSNGLLHCRLCRESVEDNLPMIDAHRTTRKHFLALEKAPVIASLDTEFIRELDGVYHCGYCNIVAENWEDLHNHFNSIVHRESKTAAEWRVKELIVP